MTAPRRLVLALVLVGLAWFAVAVSRGEDEPGDRPEQLTAVAFDDLERIVVTDPATSTTAVLRADGDRLIVADGAEVPADRLGVLRDDLFPLLAVRSLDEQRAAFGLDEPRLVVEITGSSSTETIRIGAANFDDTGRYASVDGRLALVLSSVYDVLAETVASEVGQAEP